LIGVEIEFQSNQDTYQAEDNSGKERKLSRNHQNKEEVKSYKLGIELRKIPP